MAICNGRMGRDILSISMMVESTFDFKESGSHPVVCVSRPLRTTTEDFQYRLLSGKFESMTYCVNRNIWMDFC